MVQNDIGMLLPKKVWSTVNSTQGKYSTIFYHTFSFDSKA